MKTTYRAGFNIATPKPQVGPGFDFNAIGDGKTILRWDKVNQDETLQTKDGKTLKWHRLNMGIARYNYWDKFSTKKTGIMIDAMSPYWVSIKVGAHDVWQGRGYWDTLHAIASTVNGWVFNGNTYKTLLAAIRVALKETTRTCKPY